MTTTENLPSIPPFWLEPVALPLHLQAASEVVSFFLHFPTSTGVTNRDSDCSILCLSVAAS
jgi:hypothetical protein